MPGVKGKSGPKHKPTILKELAGTMRDDRRNVNEPDLPALDRVPRCPAHLQGEARKAWRQVAKWLTDMRVLTEPDTHALEVYCDIYARWVHATEQLRTFGVMLSKDGNLFPSPYLRIVETCSQQMRQWMGEFGITPSSRSRVKAEKPANDDNLEDWFGIHKN
jgi:P27 family predicted phage terminase small subunit